MGIFYIILAALCWSSGGVLLKFSNTNIAVTSAYRYLFGLISLIIICRSKPVFVIKDENKIINKKDSLLLWASAFCYAVCSFLYVCANKYTTAANAIFLQYTNPLWIIIFGPKLLGEKNSKIDYISIAGVLVGMIIFFANELTSGLEKINKRIILGDLFAILSGFCLAFYTMFTRMQKNSKAVNSSILSQILGLIFTLPFLFVNGIPDGKSVFFLFLCGLINGALALFFYPLGLKKISALSASLLSMIEPITNPIWVLIFTGEMPSPLCILGGLIILSFVVFRIVFQKKTN